MNIAATAERISGYIQGRKAQHQQKCDRAQYAAGNKQETVAPA